MGNRIETPFPLHEFLDFTGITRENKICLMDADFIKHITDDRAQKVITREMIDDYDMMKLCYRTHALEMCEQLSYYIRDPIIFCFSGRSKNTFRYHVAIEKEYKGKRPLSDTFDLMTEAMQAVIEEYVTLLFSDLEADDLLCMLQDEDTYIYSRDKDLLQVPGLHYNKEEKKIYEITTEDSIRFIAKQLLTGDGTDGIPGLNGTGEKKAEKLLNGVHYKSMINFVMKQYCKQYGVVKGTDLFANNWTLLKMRGNYGEHFTKKYEEAFILRDAIKKNNLTLNP